MKMKRQIKDSVFTCLFRQPEYCLQLYKELHPEDTDVTQKDLEIITLKNILTDTIYNDFGMIVRGMIIFLMEAQSTFPANIAIRLFLYLAEIYQRHIDTHQLNVYSQTPIRLPAVELYVVYTGDKPTPDVIRLTDLCDGVSDVEVCVHVLRGTEQSDTINQYVQFCHIADQQRKQYGYTKHAVEETIRLCLEKDVLSSFLQSRQEEVADIMSTLFSQRKVWEVYERDLRKEAIEQGLKEGREQGLEQGREQGLEQGREQGLKQGREQGIQQGIQQSIGKTIALLKKFSVNKETIVEGLMEQFHLTKEDAEAKVEQY